MKNITIIEKHIAKGKHAVINRELHTLQARLVDSIYLIGYKKYEDAPLYVYEDDLLNSKIITAYMKAQGVLKCTQD